MSVLLKRADSKGCHYELSLLKEGEGDLLCKGLSEYLDPSKRIIGEQKLRNLIGLEDEASLDEGTLKVLLNGIRSTIVPFEQEVD